MAVMSTVMAVKFGITIVLEALARIPTQIDTLIITIAMFTTVLVIP